MNARARSRNAASIGSNQPSNRATPASASGCTASGFVVGLVMAWSPARRASTGLVRVGQPGDYATPNSTQPRDGTVARPLDRLEVGRHGGALGVGAGVRPQL